MRHLIAAALVFLASCSGGPTEPPPEPPVIQRLDVTPTLTDLKVLDSITLSAQAFSASGALVSAPEFRWSTSDASVATVRPTTGELVARGPGVAEISVTAQEVTARLPLTVHVETITFDRMPDGSGSCDRCPLSDQFAPWGVRFSFYTDPDLEADSTLTLLRVGARFPGDAPANHVVGAPRGPRGGSWAGVMVASFETPADTVTLLLEGPHSVGSFPVRAYGPDGALLPDGVVRVVSSEITTFNTGFDFRRDRVMVQAAAGIARVEMDGRSKSTGSARGGFALLLDDLRRWPDP